MDRKTLKIDDVSATFNQFSTKKSSKIDKSAIEKISEDQGFTKREVDSKKKSAYSEQFNARCKKGMNDLTSDILYHKKIKKQVFLELAIKAYLEKESLDILLSKYQAII